MVTDTQHSSVHGQWRTHDGLPSVQGYSYDGVGRLTQAQDSSKDSLGNLTCTTRSYAFGGTSGTDSNRTSLTTYNPAADNTCQTTTAASTVSNTYDSADRLQPTGRAASVV